MVRKIGPLPVLCLIVSLSASAVLAQDSRSGSEPRFRAPQNNNHSHSGSSPFSPPHEDDTLFVSDTGGGLDTGCTYRSGGPLTINVRVKRYVGPVGANGFLSDPQGLVSRGLVTPKAKLILPVFDIDVNGAPGVPPEVDSISFNGHNLGRLTGDNNIWKQNSFEVPIEWVKFPTRGAPGSAPTPANNEIRINIDQASGSAENWCMSVDWVQIKFGAIAPILLVHGTNAQSDSWDPNFTAFFRNSGAPWSNDINLRPNGSILGNGALLSARVRALATSFGAKKVHIIGHSKGGLDTRAYLNNNYQPSQVKVLSVFTLGTPHKGTIVSDIIVARRTTVDAESSDPNIRYLMANDYWFLSTPQPPAINNQMTTAMARFNATYPNVPRGVKFYNYGADADLNDDRVISAAETEPLIPAMTPNGIARAAGNAMYNAIGRIAAISITPGRRWIFGMNHFTSIEVARLNPFFHANDLVTSIESAVSPGGNYLGTRDGNHSSMKSNALAQQILNRIKSDYPVR